MTNNNPVRHATQTQKEILSGLLEIGKYEHEKPSNLSPFFLRRPYSGTSAEPHDYTQEQLHELDWMK